MTAPAEYLRQLNSNTIGSVSYYRLTEIAERVEVLERIVTDIKRMQLRGMPSWLQDDIDKVLTEQKDPK
jgi:hypothetical protein